MTKRKFRIPAILLAGCLLLGCILVPTRAANPGGVQFLNTHVNTGNQRMDIISVALTQLGYEEKYENDTKYGDWLGYPGYAWCAMFVSWCARQAEVPTDVLTQHSWAHPNSFNVPYYHGTEYTPQPGDLFFTGDFGHMGIVWYVEGEFFYCVEGNAKYHDYTVPNDPTVDSYHVMTNKRLISDHYFGVPPYGGGDPEHTYVKGTESEHPHKTYYQCETCEERYYTSYTECHSDCSQCMSCGCSAEYAGYYLVTSDSSPVNMRKKHDASSASIGYATVGEVVYVYGADPGSGRAYIEYDGHRGHVWLRFLTKYTDIPAAPAVTAEKTEYSTLDTVTLNWSAPEYTEQYRLKLFKDGSLQEERILDLAQSCSLEQLPEGAYEARVIACNRAGFSEAGTLCFTVRNLYTLTYDACGGTGAPEAQTQKLGEPVAVSTEAPTREGYTFLGWTDTEGQRRADIKAGELLTCPADTVLYAVWKADGAVSQSLEILQKPFAAMYLPGEALDTEGLKLKLTYSDGSEEILTSGYTLEGFSTESLGTKEITVNAGGVSAVFEVQVVSRIPGDIDLDKTVDRDDVMSLLWHISFPERFAIEAPADFTADGQVNRDDVMRLLWHISFPDRFPLAM